MSGFVESLNSIPVVENHSISTEWIFLKVISLPVIDIHSIFWKLNRLMLLKMEFRTGHNLSPIANRFENKFSQFIRVLTKNRHEATSGHLDLKVISKMVSLQTKSGVDYEHFIHRFYGQYKPFMEALIPIGLYA